MKLKIVLIIIFISSNIFSQSLIDTVGEQLLKKDKIFDGRFPLFTENGKWLFSDKPNWFAGFTSGELWYLYDLTGNEEYKRRALIQADSLIQFAELDNTHDLGFIFMNSCVKAFQHTGEMKYKIAALKAAQMLMKRYNENGRFIRAWGKLSTNDREGLMIIDTMMNLELLFWASQESKDYHFYDVAYNHALTCLKQIVRNNFSSYHVIEFDVSNGNIKRKFTHQGFSDESTWARGQAWGIYGFAIAYKFTQDERFLNASKKMAEYFLAHLPNDFIPTWDLDLLGKTEIKDASAAAIASSGMFLLSELIQQETLSLFFVENALKITKSLKENYIFSKSKRENEEGILLHTVYNFHKNWGIDESFPCGDFYFIECLKKENDYLQKKYFIKENKHRQSYLINSEWFYLEEPIENFEELSKNSNEWVRINLPHTWNKIDALDQQPGYRRSISWYKKEFYLPKFSANKKIVLHFEGVNNKAEIYVNNRFAGKHIGGYVGFDIDISDLVKEGEQNFIFVKADNSFDPYLIPSQKSDFILYGGITRNVRLNIYPEDYIKKVLIQTPVVSIGKAETNVKIDLNLTSKNKFQLNFTLKENSGETIFSKKFELKNKNEFSLPEIKNPKLWSPQNPFLYSLEIELFANDISVDKITEQIGYRFYEFKENGAFFLNGERLLLKGTHRHEELSGFGNALPDSIHRKDIQMIKDLGANFVRLAHYPQAPEVYKACDELGILVWDENPWCRGGVGPKQWQDNTKKIFQEMILQNYNHPSIILWSIGNESDWLPDFENGDNPDSLKKFSIELHQLAKRLDPYRLTATRKFSGTENIVDVFSPSIWSGWYSDVYKNYRLTLEKVRQQYKRFFHAEYGGDSHLGRHTENPIDGEGKIKTSGGEEPINKIQSSSVANIGDWSESYIVDLFDWYLQTTQKLDWFSGSAQWIFRDFTTPLRPENPIPYVNEKGLVDMNNNRKDAYYVFKSYWTKSPAFCYIESHTWTERNGGKNEKKEINVFSNCEEVELFVNGISQGKLKKDLNKFPACGLSWKSIFNEGKNNIKAIGYSENKIVTLDSIEINYITKKIGKPNELILSSERLQNGNYLITALAIDNSGNHCVDYNDRVYFSSLSGGILIDNLGTTTGSSVIQMSNGKAQIVFKHIPDYDGIIEVRNQDFKGTYLTIKAK